MRLKYIGGIDRVDIPLPSGLVVSVDRGGEFDAPDEYAARLLEQTVNYEPVKKPAKQKEGDSA